MKIDMKIWEKFEGLKVFYDILEQRWGSMKAHIDFDEIRNRVFNGKLKQSQVDGINFIMQHIDNIDLHWIAYILATVTWETAYTMQPILEYGGKERAEKLYGYKTRIGKELGNKKEGDGAKYMGRGYCMITGYSNYEKFTKLLKPYFVDIDLINNPDDALNPEVAIKIIEIGMLQGTFTGKKLSDYFNEEVYKDFEKGLAWAYVNARRVINGLDKAEKIADIAKKYFDALRQGVEVVKFKINGAG